MTETEDGMEHNRREVIFIKKDLTIATGNVQRSIDNIIF
jgi:hypothetical protein